MLWKAILYLKKFISTQNVIASSWFDLLSPVSLSYCTCTTEQLKFLVQWKEVYLFSVYFNGQIIALFKLYFVKLHNSLQYKIATICCVNASHICHLVTLQNTCFCTALHLIERHVLMPSNVYISTRFSQLYMYLILSKCTVLKI